MKTSHGHPPKPAAQAGPPAALRPRAGPGPGPPPGRLFRPAPGRRRRQRRFQEKRRTVPGRDAPPLPGKEIHPGAQRRHRGAGPLPPEAHHRPLGRGLPGLGRVRRPRRPGQAGRQPRPGAAAARQARPAFPGQGVAEDPPGRQAAVRDARPPDLEPQLGVPDLRHPVPALAAPPPGHRQLHRGPQQPPPLQRGEAHVRLRPRKKNNGPDRPHPPAAVRIPVAPGNPEGRDREPLPQVSARRRRGASRGWNRSWRA